MKVRGGRRKEQGITAPERDISVNMDSRTAHMGHYRARTFGFAVNWRLFGLDGYLGTIATEAVLSAGLGYLLQ